MKTINFPEKTSDPVISEIRAIKRQIVAEHGGDLDSFFAAIRQRQRHNPRLVNKIMGEQGTEQPATRSESKSEGDDKPQPEAEGRSR